MSSSAVSFAPFKSDFNTHTIWPQQRLQHDTTEGQEPIITTATQMIVTDAIHGTISLPDHIKEIVLHPLFQRLKKIKQLGFLANVSGADHTRYDHCIGTYKSAQDQLNALERNSNYLPKLPDWCRLAVEIAALLHDVGHGPFSHSWEHVCQHDFNHEINGLACVDTIFDDVTSSELRALRDDNDRGVKLVKALIRGERNQLLFPMLCHNYIFDIVHNENCGLDVDKWDYLRRDNHRLRLLTDKEMQFDEVFLNARIAPDGQRIEYRYDDYHRIYQLYTARWRLHIGAYQLPKVIALDDIFAGIVNRNYSDLLRVNAENGISAWLEFHDANVMKSIANDTQTLFLHCPERLVEVPEGTANAIHVRREIPAPGVAMQKDENYPCYGDANKKRSIQRLLVPTIINKWFRMQ